jgi:hypothetical protein
MRLGPLVLALGIASASGQTGDLPRPHRYEVEYDGRVTFVRLRWQSGLGGFRGGGFGSAWNHDTPRAEQHLSLILNELTLVGMRANGSLILSLDDPELFKYPIAFMWEPGFWNLTDREAASFRAYLLKGGFAVFEGFDGAQQWAHFDRFSTPSSASRTSRASSTPCTGFGRAITGSSRTTIPRGV